MGEMKPIKAKMVEPTVTHIMKVVLPSGTEVLSQDFYALSLAHPVVIELPVEAIANVD